MRNKALLYLIIIAFLSVASWMATAEAFDTYSSDGATGNCADCHGNFLNATYTSLAAAKAGSPSWPNGLHNTHRNTMLNGNCNACHSAGSRSPVLLFSSVGPAPFNQSCTGCHAGAGLRSHHANKGVGICADCHGGGSGGRENTLPLVYTAALGTTSGTTRVNNPCSPTAGGFEGQFADGASIGLDNDGDGLYDLNDPDCAPPAAPQIAATPASLSFGAVTVGAAASQNVTVSNSGNATLSVTPARCAGTSTEYTFSPAAAFTVPAAGSAVLSVTYTPSAAGADTGCIALTHNASNAASPLNVNVSGTGQVLQPVLSVSPTTASFGNVAVGSTANQTINVSNTGTATLTGSVSIPTGAPFTVSPTSFSISSGGAAVSLTVTFAPTAVGPASASMAVTSNGGNQNVSLSGAGTAAVLSTTPTSVNFGNVTVGSTANQTVTVSNTGNATLTGSISIPVGSRFSVSPTSFSIPSGGAAVSLTVTFAPTATGAASATMAITSNGGNQNVGLSGSGTPAPAPLLSVTPTTASFGNVTVGSTANQTVTVSNTGNATLTGSISIPVGSRFSVSPTSFSIPSGGAAVSLTVTFAPTATGAASATMAITSNGGNQNVSLSGAGTAVPVPVLSVSPLSVTYADTQVGSTANQTVTVSNTGAATLTGNVSVPAGAPFTVSPASFSISSGGAAVSLTVTFAPIAVGGFSATLGVTSNGGNQNVSLSGNGVPVPPAPQPVITVSPLSVVFPNTQSGSTATATVAVTNTGTATLNVTSINVTPGAATPANTFTVTPSSFSIPQGGAPVNLTVSFKPTATGAFTANMAVASNDPVTPTVGVGLSGNGVPVPPVPQPVISVVPTTLDFGGVQTGNTATLTVAVSNTGNATLTGSVSVPSGTPFSVTPTSFSIPSGGAAVNLAATYAPTATGPHSTTMTVISNASNASTVGVALSGNGTAPPSQAAAIQLNPASLNFGAVTVSGSATLTTEIKNTGTAMLEVDVINLCGGTSPEFSWSPVLPPTIAVDPGAKEVLSVTYTPTASGADTGCLAVVSNDPAQPTVKLGVAGSGAAPQTNGVDIDIEEFKVKSKIDICPAPREANPVRISLEAENDGRVGGCSSATVVGMQNDVKVYDKTIELCLPAKGEGAFSFPGFKPTKTGTIVWTVTVKDGYPDADTAKTTTRVVCRPREEGGDASRR